MSTAIDPAEAATVAQRLSHELGCQSIALIGCVRPGLISRLSTHRLVGFDAPIHTSYARALAPGERWLDVDEVGSTIGDLPQPLAMISVNTLDELDGAAVDAILASVPAAVVLDVDGCAGHGPEGLRELRDRVAARGIPVLRAELIAPLDGAAQLRSSPSLIIGRDEDWRVRTLIETGYHNLRLDPAVDTFREGDRPCRVCMVSYEIVGPTTNGGIGTANTSLALALARAGHDVTILYTTRSHDAETFAHWQAHFAERRISYFELAESDVSAVASPHINVRRSWAAYEWVRQRHEQQAFDVIHAPECQGHAAHIALARRQGRAFGDAQVVVGVHSTTRWCAEANRRPLSTLESLTDDVLEQVSVENADVVVSPSGYLLGYLRSRGWKLPTRSFVQQYVTSEAVRNIQAERAEEAPPAERPREIVFFGRLEPRKGLIEFCNALDRVAAETASDHMSVTFLGSSVVVQGQSSTDYIESRSAAWPWPMRLLTDLSQPEAVSYLRAPHRLAVMPSLVDNSPNTVYEALGLQIPILVSRVGGTGELVALDDQTHSSFAAWPETGLVHPVAADVPSPEFNVGALAEAILQALERTAEPIRPALDPEVNERVHLAWHSAATRTDAPPQQQGEGQRAPRTTVIALSGMTSGIPADPGDSDARQGLTGSPASASYNLAAREAVAAADLLVFLPDDVTPAPQLPAVVARVAAMSNADVFVWPVTDPCPDGGAARTMVPVSGPAVMGLSYPYFGTNGFAIRTDAFRALGGFSEATQMDQPVTDLLTRAALDGLRFEVVAEVLGTRTTPHRLRPLLSNQMMLEAVPWEAASEQELERLRPFGHPEQLSDLPALYRNSQETLATFFGRLGTLQWNLDVAQQQLQDANVVLEGVMTSRSWRITRPLRWGVQAARRSRT